MAKKEARNPDSIFGACKGSKPFRRNGGGQTYFMMKKRRKYWLITDSVATGRSRGAHVMSGDQRNFRSEIPWRRQTAHSDSKQGAKNFGDIHDVILFYTFGDDYTWNVQYRPYDKSYIDNFYKHIEPETGRRYRLGDLTTAKEGGDTSCEWHGVKP